MEVGASPPGAAAWERNPIPALSTCIPEVSDRGPAEEGYQDLVRNMSLKPYPSLEGLRNIQRLTKLQNPKIAEVKVEDLVDSRFVRKLDESGFLERLNVVSARR